MAQPSTIYRAGIQLSDIDRGLYESLQITVARHPSETEERLLARLLAYALYYESDLVFTKGVGAGDEPDLWSKGPDGRVRSWIEVGLPDAERLVKASRHSEQVVLCAFGPALPVWEKQHLPKLAGISNLTVISLEQAFLGQLAKRLQRTITWSLTVTEASLYLAIDGETLESAVNHLIGPDFYTRTGTHD
ncbi:MAG: YaeQ family protein [Desulfobacteraceae bacterium]|nr:YaeQ family protein [Desulfobacteraceae bacterium]